MNPRLAVALLALAALEPPHFRPAPKGTGRHRTYTSTDYRAFRNRVQRRRKAKGYK